MIKQVGRGLMSQVMAAKVDLLLGDSAKAARELGWKPEVEFNGLIEMTVEADVVTHEESRN